MDADFQQTYHELEAAHWWFVGRRAIVADLLQRVVEDRAAKVLDIGCSGGHLIEELAARGFENVEGIDISESAIELCRQRGITRSVLMDAGAPTIAESSYDVLIASDVLEHLADDQRSLKSWYRIVRPGGLLIVFVPAFQALWSDHDVVNHHFRRYTRAQLSERLAEAGFVVQRSSYWNSVIFPAAAVVRLAQQWRPPRAQPKADLRPAANATNQLLRFLIAAENIWHRSLPSIAGLSTFAIAQKPC